MYVVSDERFEEFVEEAMASLPANLAGAVDNVVFVIEDESEGRNLFGLFQGIPLTRRSPLSYAATMPDRITIYQGAICRACSSEEEVRRQVRVTVLHEIAHHFGISDPRLEELGWA